MIRKMLGRVFDMLKTVNVWHLIPATIVSVVIFTGIMDIIISFIWWGRISKELVIIGSIDSFVESSIATPLVIYFVLRLQKTEIDAARALRKAHDQLEILVGERTLELSKTVRTLEEQILERKRAELGLQERERFLASVFESIQDGLSIIDDKFNIVRVNPTVERWFSHNRPLVGSKCFDVYLNRGEPCEDCPCRRALLSGKSDYGVVRKTDRAGEGSGWFEVFASPLIDLETRQVEGVIEYIRDVTEIKKAEDELIKAGKLESLGVLAGGIAHDFNNLLTSIMGNISSAIMYTSPDDKIQEPLKAAEKASFKARDLTHQLLTFAKGGEPVKKTVHIAGLIKEAAGFAQSGSNVRCEFHVADDLLPVEADEGQISQVIQNLVLNAEQAMPDGGTVEVHAGNLSIDSSSIMSLGKGDYVEITVRDHGVGIPEKNLPNIFDPYFSTKPNGSGLGLASVHSIITKHDGRISVDSDVGKGSTFHVYLPASAKEVLVKPQDKKAPGTAGGLVLVMDDEEIVRETLGFMLKLLGYRAEFAADSSETVSMYKKARDAGSPFDAVIMDLTIPGGMGGKETIKLLLEMDPEVKAVVSSGYSNDPIMSEYEKYGFRGVLGKPYEINGLGRVLQGVIAAAGSE